MYAVDQLRLAAIVGGAGAPRAMMIDPRGKGWVVAQGDLLGRPEVVHAGTADRQASWRIDRIRERDVVLVRDDPADPAAAGVTRVLALPADPVEIAEGDEFAAR
jgi:type IV pilus assembly protein PilP